MAVAGGVRGEGREWTGAQAVQEAAGACAACAQGSPQCPLAPLCTHLQVAAQVGDELQHQGRHLHRLKRPRPRVFKVVRRQQRRIRGVVHRAQALAARAAQRDGLRVGAGSGAGRAACVRLACGGASSPGCRQGAGAPQRASAATPALHPALSTPACGRRHRPASQAGPPARPVAVERARSRRRLGQLSASAPCPPHTSQPGWLQPLATAWQRALRAT